MSRHRRDCTQQHAAGSKSKGERTDRLDRRAPRASEETLRWFGRLASQFRLVAPSVSRWARTCVWPEADFSWLVDLIEDAAVGEMRGLRLLPAAERFVDGEQIHFAELCCVLRGGRLQTRPVVVAAGDVLPLRVYRYSRYACASLRVP